MELSARSVASSATYLVTLHAECIFHLATRVRASKVGQHRDRIVFSALQLDLMEPNQDRSQVALQETRSWYRYAHTNPLIAYRSAALFPPAPPLNSDAGQQLHLTYGNNYAANFDVKVCNYLMLIMWGVRCGPVNLPSKKYCWLHYGCYTRRHRLLCVYIGCRLCVEVIANGIR